MTKGRTNQTFKMTEEQTEQAFKKIIDDEFKRMDEEGHRPPEGKEEIYLRARELEANMKAFMESIVGKSTKTFIENYTLINELLESVIDRQLPTHETADFMKRMIDSMAANVGYIAAVTGGKDEEASGMISELYKDFFEIKSMVLQYVRFAELLQDLLPELTEELKHPQYAGKDINTLYREYLKQRREAGDIEPAEPSLLDLAISAAQEARKAKTRQPQKSIVFHGTDSIDFPLDKINGKVWNLLEHQTAGQIEFNVARHGSKDIVPVYYSIDFDELGKDITITKRLLPFDKRVYLAISALYNAGNDFVTLSQIYKHMGYKGKSGENDKLKIRSSVIKMLGARIYLSNALEAEKYKYLPFNYTGSLLPVEMVEPDTSYSVNGGITDALIHIFREPPVVSFARQRHQITTINLGLLQSTMNKTDRNLLIDDYLIERISKAKNGRTRKHSCRILYKTLCDHAGIKENTEKDRKARQRMPDTVKKYLLHYQSQGFITRYTAEPDGVTIYWN